MKQILALVAAFLITSLVGLGMFVIGANAATNPDSIPVNNAPGDPAAAVNTSASSPSVQPGDAAQSQAQINQLSSLITQYQNREKQYKAQLDQVTAQAQQEQQILDELQKRGVIRILSDGTIQILGRRN